jgi:selenide,water dikinase
MRQLNRAASETLQACGDAVHAATDVTGFGLAGHGWEMAERSSAALLIDTAALPLYPGALAAAAGGTRTGGDRRNRDYLGERITTSAPADLEALCFDPQTSGGLLAAVAPTAVSRLTDAGFAVIGEVVAGAPGVTLE